MMIRRAPLGALVLALLAATPACVRTGLAPGKTGAQAAKVNVQLAIEYMKIGKLAPARETIERAMTQDADSADVQLTAGLIYERLNESVKAERAYSAAARLGKADPNIQNNYAGYLCRTGKAAAGEKLFNEVARNPAYQTPEVAWVNAGVCALSTGDALDAQRYFDKALTIRPNMPEAMLQLGNLAMDSGDAAEALDYAQRLLAANPPSAEVLWLGFRAQRKLGNATAAAAFARRVQTEFPDSDQARLMRSGVDR
jgi:type IV pilus assembly protein PilF